MTKKTRRALFIIAVIAFVAISFVLTMYARGYRWDFDKNKFLLAGAIYIESIYPPDTEIYVNNKSTDKLSSSLIKNLLPLRKYQVKIAKAGYQDWSKDFEITPGLVVEAKNVVLFPQELKTSVIWPNAGLSDFTVSPNQEIIAAKTTGQKLVINTISENNFAALTNINFSDKRKTLGLDFIKNGRGWSENSKELLFSRNIFFNGQIQKIWYVWQKEPSLLIQLNDLYEKEILLKNPSATPLPKKFAADKIVWLNNDSVISKIGKQLFQLDLKNKTITDLNLSDIVDFDVAANRIIALKNPDILLSLDSSVQNVAALGQTKFVPENILISPDASTAAYFNKNSAGIIWLKDSLEQPLRQNGDQEIIFENKNIASPYWHNSNEYLMFIFDGKLNVAELDTRGQKNIYIWPETISAIDYLAGNSKLFLLENGALKSVDDKF